MPGLQFGREVGFGFEHELALEEVRIRVRIRTWVFGSVRD